MKKLFWYLLLIFIVVVIITLVTIINKKVIPTPQKQDEISIKLATLNNIDKKIDYFNYKYLDRYICFKQNNPSLSDLDIIIRVNIGLDKPFYQDTKKSNKLNQLGILVNKYIYLPEDYIPNNLSTISSEYSNSNKQLVYEAKEAFEKMASAAKKENYNIRAISAYRSYEYQKNLYDNYVSKDGVDKVDTYSARPGYSEHQTGLVVDIDNIKTDFNNFENTDEFKWMQDNAADYGFILRYPKNKENITGYSYESWHYRYVGKEMANFIKNNNLTLDEYYVMYIEKNK